LARNQDNVSEWGEISIRELLFQWASTIKIQLSVLVKYKADLIIISLKINLFLPWYRYKIAELVLNNNHLLTLSIWYLQTFIFFTFKLNTSHYCLCFIKIMYIPVITSL
jgi:hypothetical protein